MSAAVQSSSSVDLLRIEPTWRMALRVWWSWQWRTFLGSLAIGVLIHIWAKFWFGGLNPEARTALAYVVWISVGVFL